MSVVIFRTSTEAGRRQECYKSRKFAIERRDWSWFRDMNLRSQDYEQARLLTITLQRLVVDDW